MHVMGMPTGACMCWPACPLVPLCVGHAHQGLYVLGMPTRAFMCWACPLEPLCTYWACPLEPLCAKHAHV